MPRTQPWKVSDQLWEQVEPLIPEAPSHAKGGRPRMPNRQAFEAIIYVLRTGIQWNALPRELGASSTVHDRFQEWEHSGFFQALWQRGLETYKKDNCQAGVFVGYASRLHKALSKAIRQP